MNDEKSYLSDAALQQSLDLPDLTEASSTPHAIRLLIDEILDGLARRGWPNAQLRAGPRIVSAQENYALLGYAASEITLGSEHTRWVNEHTLLRTQTTSQIPFALQQAAQGRQPGEMILLAAPGITYRRDTRDRWHCAEPHQMDIWVLGEPDLSARDHLLRLVGDILSLAVPGQSWITVDSPHHYTEGGIEVNVVTAERPVEVQPKCMTCRPGNLYPACRASAGTSPWQSLQGKVKKP